jgi:multicomponent Na+:H+ antiporter subunit C
MSDFISLIVAKYNYWIYITLMMIGLYAMIAKNNLVKKIIGMSIFQTAIILFFVSTGAKKGATIPRSWLRLSRGACG